VPEAHDALFRKQVHNAFTGTSLATWLRERGIGRVIISGIRTEQCCETTARVASDLGFDVDYVTEATLTFTMVHAGSGTRYDARDIKQRTELVLDGRFARIRTVDDVLADH
jgi:nicotinamidase-related amidase